MTQDLLAYSSQVNSSDNLRPIGSRSPIRRGRLQNNKRRYLKRDVCVPTLQKIWQIALIYIPSVPESLKSGADGHSDKKETPPKGCLRNVFCKRSLAALRMTVYNYLFSAVATSTAQATVQPTIGLLPMPRNPIISTCAGTDDDPANCASECIRPIVSVIP